MNDELRDELAAALRGAHGTGTDDVDGRPYKYPLTLMPDALADAILPVVRRYAAQQLRDAAAEVRDNHGTASLSAKRIDARADAIEAGE